LIFLQSCVSTQVAINIQSSLNTKDLRTRFGPPNQILDNGSSGSIWLYSETWVRQNKSTQTSVTYDKTIKFWVRDGKVYQWQTYGHELKRLSTIGWLATLSGGALLGVLIGNATY